MCRVFLCVVFLLSMGCTLPAQDNARLHIYYLTKDSFGGVVDDYNYFFRDGLLSQVEKVEVQSGVTEVAYSFTVTQQEGKYRVWDKKNDKEVLLTRADSNNYIILTKSKKKVFVTLLNDVVYIGGQIEPQKRDESIRITEKGIEFRYNLNLADAKARAQSSLQDVVLSELGDLYEIRFLSGDRTYKEYVDPKSLLLKSGANKKYLEYDSTDENGRTTDTAYLLSYNRRDARAAPSILNYLILRYLDMPDATAVALVMGGGFSKLRRIGEIF